MISLVMPYWRRLHALEQNLENYRKLYPHEALEIIVVDDGSGELPGGAEGWSRLICLPEKTDARNPCMPFNRGVAAANGEFIVLTNPEVIHRAPILQAMREQLQEIGPKGYVAAACWSKKQNKWFCHSGLPQRAMGRAKMPEGAGLHFCAMLHRSLYDEIDGFSEEYRDGQGYEDSDFLWKLQVAGAQFTIRDDLVTDHIDCPRTQWMKGGLKRNRHIFEAKWGA